MCHFDTVAECHKHCQFVFYWGQTSSQQPPVSTVRYCNEAEKKSFISQQRTANSLKHMEGKWQTSVFGNSAVIIKEHLFGLLARRLRVPLNSSRLMKVFSA